MIQKAKKRVKNYPNIKIIKESYANIDSLVKKEKIPGIDYILLDLGVNMEHFKDQERGFSINSDYPLDMRFDRTQETSARTIIRYYPFEKLKKIFIMYADFGEKKAEEISHAIIKQRKKQDIVTSRDLKKIFASCSIGQKASIVLFQAIRIEVNQEMNNLELFLEKIPSLMNPQGRIAIMSYHSIEDRIVKTHFKQLSQQGFQWLNKKTIKPHYTEIQKNRASRSAKFRIIEKDNY
ncbi:MAG: 16S rRNA (cytosine(1402)-N(4))-methyltransferase RsmH [bacterium]|nr:16S rRNA (cytosine(1402)-N(4))-methyltransferase RsmH [bacterium]